jgi:hypothetical protein
MDVKFIATGTDTRLGEDERYAIKTSFLTTFAAVE